MEEHMVIRYTVDMAEEKAGRMGGGNTKGRKLQYEMDQTSVFFHFFVHTYRGRHTLLPGLSGL